MWGWVWGWRVPMFDKLNYFRSSFSRCNLVCSKEDTQLNARKQKITQTFALGNINAHFYHSCFVFFLLLSPRAHTVSGCFNFLSHWLHSFLSFVSPPPFFPPPLLSYWVWCGDAPAWLVLQLQTLRLRAGVRGLHHCLWGAATGMDWRGGSREKRDKESWEKSTNEREKKGRERWQTLSI